MKKVLFAVVLALGAMSAQAECYSEGVRVGVIQKFSRKGAFNKSWEAEMVQEGERVKAKGNGAGVTNLWKFSTLDAGVAKQLDDAVFSGATVAVRYCQKGGLQLMGQTDTEYLITAVRVRQ